ncbi:hypothetical protein [Salinimicrobium soli]|uniref:hypothetical protein n=1 Tax=Salinimicrobium soli TaxID=1254399 RepID=UPI003AB0EC08
MEKKKKISVIILSILGFLILVFIALSFYFSNRIKNSIDEAIGKDSSYKEADVDLLQRQITIDSLDFNGNGKQMAAKKISLKGIGLIKYIFDDKLVINRLVIEGPDIIFSEKKNDSSSGGTKGFSRNITVKNVEFHNGNFRLKKKDTTGNDIFISFPTLTLSAVHVDSATVKNRMPFQYETYSFYSDSLRININPQHYVAAEEVRMENGKTEIKDFKILPYYEKAEFDQVIPYEKDRISLRVKNIQLDSLQIEYKKDQFYLRNPMLTVTGGDLEVYRNKLLPDDPRKRPLYSSLLRNAPVKLDFKKVRVRNSKIQYQEKVKEGIPPAEVIFSDIDADITSLTNINLDRKDFPETKVHVNATFQKVSPLEVDWTFNVTNPNDKFLFKGKFGAVPGDALNPLLRPSMNMEAKGTIKDAWFTFTGNDEVLTGDVRLNYDQFKFIWLKKGSNEKRGFFTAIANLFVDNDGISGDHKSREVRVERDPHRSFWAYVWNGLQNGMKNTFSQL